MAISFFLLLHPAYLQYNNLVEVDFFSSNPTFENLDQEDMLADQQSKVKVLASSISTVIFLLRINLVAQLPRLSFQIFSFDHQTYILRC